MLSYRDVFQDDFLAIKTGEVFNDPRTLAIRSGWSIDLLKYKKVVIRLWGRLVPSHQRLFSQTSASSTCRSGYGWWKGDALLHEVRDLIRTILYNSGFTQCRGTMEWGVHRDLWHSLTPPRWMASEQLSWQDALCSRKRTQVEKPRGFLLEAISLSS